MEQFKSQFENLRLEFHIIQSFPVSCLNRDDVGSPKTAIVGGIPRARVSSQCWKRAVRMKMHELGGKEAFRTKLVEKLVADKCVKLMEEQYPDKDKNEIQAQAQDCGKYAAQILGTKAEEGSKSVLFFISDSEVEAIADYFKGMNFTLPKDDTENKKDKKDKKKKDNKLIKIMKDVNLAKDGVDIALFGRMAADSPELNVEAATAFAHAISIHRVDTDFDYFTALDDCQEEGVQGAAHLDVLNFNSATYYRYVSLDLGQLAKTLQTDDIARYIEIFTQALFLAVPPARQASMSAATPWNYAIVAIRKGQRLQIPFTAPVKPTKETPDMVSAGIKALKENYEGNKKLYGSLFGEEMKMEVGIGYDGIDDLVQSVNNYLQKQCGQ